MDTTLSRANGCVASFNQGNIFRCMIELALSGQVLVWMIMLGVLLGSGQASVFHPSTIYLLFHGLAFVLRPILVHYFGFHSIWKYIGSFPGDAEFMFTLAVTSVALVVFVSASLLMGRAAVRFASKAEPS